MLSPPWTIGPYRILDVLGQGGMGVVYRVQHGETGLFCALKTVHAPRATDLRGIRREIQALARIQHPGIVRILDHGVEAGAPWYAMELVEGIALHQACSRSGPPVPVVQEKTETFGEPWQPSWWTESLAPALLQVRAPPISRLQPRSPPGTMDPAPGKRPGPWKTAANGRLPIVLSLVRRLCTPLAYLHGEGIVHRDLKPQNVLVCANEQVVLMDFGLAADFSRLSGNEHFEQAGHVLGTVAYMAPEQVRGELVDPRSDLYALGCMLYRLVTGIPPFQGKTDLEVAMGHLQDLPKRPSEIVEGVPRKLDQLLLRLLEKSPRRRLGHASDVAAILEGLGAVVASGPPAPEARPYLYRPGLMGRRGPMGVLKRQLGALKSGAGSVVFLQGERGIGKTRLMSEISQRAGLEQIAVIAGVASIAERSPLSALRPILRWIADHCRERGEPESRRVLGQRAGLLGLFEPELLDLIRNEPPAELLTLPPEAARQRLYEALMETLTALTQPDPRSHRGRGPFLILLEDLHWADELSLGFLRFALDKGFFASHPLALVGTLRSSDLPVQLAALASRSEVVRIELGSLEERFLRQMLGEMLMMPRVPEPLFQFISLRSEGNPAIAVEHLRLAVEEGLLTRLPTGTWHFSAAAQGLDQGWLQRLDIPEQFREVLRRRLASLKDTARSVADAAALHGRESDLKLLAKVVGVEDEQFSEALDELRFRNILVETEPGRARFVSDNLRDAALEQLAGDSRLKALHLTWAQVMDRDLPRQEALALRAWHWENAGEAEIACEAYLQAARLARKQFAHSEAERLYRDYQRLTRTPSSESVAARNELAFDVLFAQGKTAEAVQQLELALVESAALGERRQEMTANYHLGWIRFQGSDLEAAEKHCAVSLFLASGLGDRAGQGRALGTLGAIAAVRGRPGEAEALLERALEIRRQLPGRPEIGPLLNNLAMLRLTQGKLSESRALFEEALQLAREIGHRPREAHTLSNLGTAAYHQGRLDDAQAIFEEALRLGRDTSDPTMKGNSLGYLALIHRIRGQSEKAESLLGQALEVAQKLQNRAHQGRVHASLGELSCRTGRFEEARQHFEQMNVFQQQTLDQRMRAESVGGVGALCLEDGDIRACRRVYEKALQEEPELENEHWLACLRLGITPLWRLCFWATESSESAQLRLLRSKEVLLRRGFQLELFRCLCETGHLELALGRSAQQVLEGLRELGSRLGAPSLSEPGRALAQLERAEAAFSSGKPLYRGQCVEDLPAGLREWLLDSGQLDLPGD